MALTGASQPLVEAGTRSRVGLLGGFELVVDGIRRRPPLSVQRVVAFLALQLRPIQRGFVAGTLWPDSSEDRANANLRTALWRLGRANSLLANRPTTHLALRETVEIDLRDANARARRLIHAGGRPGLDDLARLTEAAELLPDWYDDWAQFERERFRQLRLSALECLCIELTAEGRFPEAVEAGVAAVAAEPVRESAHRALIAAHLSAGNPGEALRQYRMCRDLLAHRLGVEPSLEMGLLVAALPPGADRLAPQRSGRRVPPRPVGRPRRGGPAI
jgi:DNA-binding SARP family transcriptional activator